MSTKIITFEDITGRIMKVGDTIIYSAGGGQSTSPIHFGRITKFNKNSFYVQRLEPDLTPVMKKIGYWQGSGKFYEQSAWEIKAGRQPREIQEFIQTGQEQTEPSLVNYSSSNRFYIMP